MPPVPAASPCADRLAPDRLAPDRLATDGRPADRVGGDRLAAIERARQMYAEGVRVTDICAATGMGIGTLYYHLDGHSLPGTAVKRLPRRRDVAGNALLPLASRGRQKLAARLWRAAERQARKLEFALEHGFQRSEERAHDLAALRELTRILRDLSVLEAQTRRPAPPAQAFEHEQALAVEGRAVVVTRTRRG